MKFVIRIEGSDSFKTLIESFSLIGAAKIKFHKMLGREVIKRSRARIKGQKNLDMSPWEKRKKGKGKMLKRIMRAKNVTAFPGEKYVKVTWKNGLIGIIANQHQKGIPENYLINRNKKKNRRIGRGIGGGGGGPKFDPDMTATKTQAQALIDAGYKLYCGKTKTGRVKTKKVNRPWIINNMKAGQAGMILRKIRKTGPVKEWTIDMPARSFLGLSKEDVAEIGSEILAKLYDDVRKK